MRVNLHLPSDTSTPSQATRIYWWTLKKMGIVWSYLDSITGDIPFDGNWEHDGLVIPETMDLQMTARQIIRVLGRRYV